MKLDHIETNLEKRQVSAGLRAELRPGATVDSIDDAEARIGEHFPDQIRAFYSRWNGLSVEDPPFAVLPLDRLSMDSPTRIHFATADGIHRICFDCSRLNEAGQWDIVYAETGDRITFTMASFWSNKMWKWIDHRLEFWRGKA